MIEKKAFLSRSIPARNVGSILGLSQISMNFSSPAKVRFASQTTLSTFGRIEMGHRRDRNGLPCANFNDFDQFYFLPLVEWFEVELSNGSVNAQSRYEAKLNEPLRGLTNKWLLCQVSSAQV